MFLLKDKAKPVPKPKARRTYDALGDLARFTDAKQKFEEESAARASEVVDSEAQNQSQDENMEDRGAGNQVIQNKNPIVFQTPKGHSLNQSMMQPQTNEKVANQRNKKEEEY